MFPSVVNEETERTIHALSTQRFIRSFYLAGGTACALYLGHRVSEDLDFFSQEEFSHKDIQNDLKTGGRFLVDYSDSGTLSGRFNQTKISLFHYAYPLIGETGEFMNIKISSLKDVGCMP